MYALLGMDLPSAIWSLHIVHADGDVGAVRPTDGLLVEHMRPAMSFQLARPGGPGPFFAAMP